MQKFSTTSGVKLAKFALGLTLAAVLAACGGGGDSPAVVKVATVDKTAAISATDTVTSTAIVTAVLDKTFTFPAVSALGTTAATTLVLSGSGAAPTFSIGSEGKTATGTMGFGSCIFTITASAFVTPHPLAVGQVVTVSPCALDVKTSGDTATGTATDTPTVFLLGTTASAEVVLPVSVSPTGTVTVAGQVVGTVSTTTTTGGGN
ncbi:MAG: hypothetical protein PSV24_14160 [Rhodoferax sp.]|nr:hypothetical protein [Rhodoferax sp.]